jgi:UPF0755 protein
MTRNRLVATLFAACAALVVVIVALVYAEVALDRTLPDTKARVIVPRGTTVAGIATLLRDSGVIRSALAFRVLARLKGDGAELRAGAYAFAPHETMDEVLDQLASGGAQVATWVTIPEGFTAAQIAARLHAEGLGDAAAFRKAFAGHEGFLFPSTYLVPFAASPDDVRGMMTGEFARELPKDAAARAKALHVTLPQAVTVASLIEREAKVEADRPKIAGVIYNRLAQGMPLQIDASLEYALPEHKTALSLHDVQRDSPYNTYRHAGLPPTPIANPGLPSLQAALHPEQTDALYYVYCGNGHHVFAKTFAEHQANVARCLH